MVGVRGLEPRTPASQTRCATNCATPRQFIHAKRKLRFMNGVEYTRFLIKCWKKVSIRIKSGFYLEGGKGWALLWSAARREAKNYTVHPI